MGCCFSRSAGPNSPYPGGAPDSSSRAINPASSNPPLDAQQSASSTAPASPQQRRRRREPRPLDQHIDKPLRRHEWTATDRDWSRHQLDGERRDFFDTRVTGRAEIWQTIHAALQVLWNPSEHGDETEAMATAQTILSAAEISLPTGNLVNGVYDSLGNYYPLPEYIVCDPVNIANDSADDDAKGEGSTGADDTAADDDDYDDDVDDVGKDKAAEKGKGVVAVTEQISVKARLSENGKDYQLVVGKAETVRSVSKKIAEQAELPSTKKVRIAYMGKMLKENMSLEAQGWQSGHIINALVFFQS